VIAGDTEVRVVQKSFNAFIRLGPIANKVAKAPEGVNLANLVQHGTHGRIVAMYIRDYANTHARATSPAIAGQGKGDGTRIAYL
jgi:hypothetical protein